MSNSTCLTNETDSKHPTVSQTPATEEKPFSHLQLNSCGLGHNPYINARGVVCVCVNQIFRTNKRNYGKNNFFHTIASIFHFINSKHTAQRYVYF